MNRNISLYTEQNLNIKIFYKLAGLGKYTKIYNPATQNAFWFNQQRGSNASWYYLCLRRLLKAWGLSPALPQTSGQALSGKISTLVRQLVHWLLNPVRSGSKNREIKVSKYKTGLKDWPTWCKAINKDGNCGDLCCKYQRKASPWAALQCLQLSPFCSSQEGIAGLQVQWKQPSLGMS